MPVYFISVLRLATEQHSTLPQKGGINGRVYLFYNSRAQDPHSGWSRRGTAQGGERVWWVGFLIISKYFIKLCHSNTPNIVHQNTHMKKGKSRKREAPKNMYVNFVWLIERQGRQPLNKQNMVEHAQNTRGWLKSVILFGDWVWPFYQATITGDLLMF